MQRILFLSVMRNVLVCLKISCFLTCNSIPQYATRSVSGPCSASAYNRENGATYYERSLVDTSNPLRETSRRRLGNDSLNSSIRANVLFSDERFFGVRNLRSSRKGRTSFLRAHVYYGITSRVSHRSSGCRSPSVGCSNLLKNALSIISLKKETKTPVSKAMQDFFAGTSMAPETWATKDVEAASPELAAEANRIGEKQKTKSLTQLLKDITKGIGRGEIKPPSEPTPSRPPILGIVHRCKGTRKAASAIVHVKENGRGHIWINGREGRQYLYLNMRWIERCFKPLQVLNMTHNFDIIAVVAGGGLGGQAGAVGTAVAKELVRINPSWREELDKYGQLTTDARRVERKKPGLKKARKAPSYSKR